MSWRPCAVTWHGVLLRRPTPRRHDNRAHVSPLWASPLSRWRTQPSQWCYRHERLDVDQTCRFGASILGDGRWLADLTCPTTASGQAPADGTARVDARSSTTTSIGTRRSEAGPTIVIPDEVVYGVSRASSGSAIHAASTTRSIADPTGPDQVLSVAERDAHLQPAQRGWSACRRQPFPDTAQWQSVPAYTADTPHGCVSIIRI